jgi:hypothetical protein
MNTDESEDANAKLTSDLDENEAAEHAGLMAYVALDDRAVELRGRLEGLREERGRALLTGVAFDSGVIASIEIELAALADGQAEYARQQQQASADAERERQAKLRGQLVKAEARRLAAITRLEAATREFAEAIADSEAETQAEKRLLHALGQSTLQLRDADHLSMLAFGVLRAGGRPHWGFMGFGDGGSVSARGLDAWAPQCALPDSIIGETPHD